VTGLPAPAKDGRVLRRFPVAGRGLSLFSRLRSLTHLRLWPSIFTHSVGFYGTGLRVGYAGRFMTLLRFFTHRAHDGNVVDRRGEQDVRAAGRWTYVALSTRLVAATTYTVATLPPALTLRVGDPHQAAHNTTYHHSVKLRLLPLPQRAVCFCPSPYLLFSHCWCYCLCADPYRRLPQLAVLIGYRGVALLCATSPIPANAASFCALAVAHDNRSASV